MEAAVASVGKTVMNCLLSGAKAAITEDAEVRQSIQRDLPFLTDELAAMHNFLMIMDTENKHKMTSTRVKEIRQFAYDVEDCLQDYKVHLALISWRQLPRTILERHRITEEMKGLRSRIDDMRNRNLPYHQVEDIRISSTPERSSFASATEDLVHLIISINDKELRAIAVWGSGGVLEKTSIIKMAYDDLKISNIFECYACISLMRPFNQKEFLLSIASQFYENLVEAVVERREKHALDTHVLRQMAMTKEDDSHLVDLFIAYVKEKSYLIVLNDLSTFEEWDQIKTYFPNNQRESRILVTTNQVEVATLCLEPKNAVPELIQISADEAFFVFYKVDSSPSVGLDSTVIKSEMKQPDRIAIHSDEVVLEDDGLPESSSSPLDRDSNVALKKLCRSRTRKDQKDQFIGRRKEKYKLINLLSDCNEGYHHQVISVWGMDGTGKTTLIRSIYQSYQLEKLGFERRAWVTVPRPFQLTELLRSLAQRLVEDSPGRKGESALGFARNDLSTMGLNELSEKLMNDLTGKKYLIVLDDISSLAEWDFIISKLPRDDNNGSRIIVTTKAEGVALYCSKEETNILNINGGLTEEDALDLFLYKVRMDGDESKLKPDMMEEAKIIINKCGRLPFAVATVGGDLSARPQNIIEWRKFSDHISKELVDNNQSPEVINKNILTSRYEGLTYHLKSCFLYLSIFPEDFDIRYRRLLRRWTAEGYSSATRNRSNEKVAEEQFTALLNKSMIQQSKTIASGKTGFCQVHNLMHEVILSKSEEENLVLVLDDHITSCSKDKVRHLVVSESWSREKKDMQNIVDVSHIRSLTVFGEWRSFFLSKKMRMLRVLDLEDAYGLQDTDLVPIGKLRHLKYLSLRGSFGIFNLPNSFGNLLNLETLDIRGTWVTKLPATIGRLQNLKYLHAGMPSYDEDDTRSYGQTIISLLRDFKSFQEDMGIRFAVSLIILLISSWLRNLDLFSVEVPRGIGRLRAIHTLSVVNIARGKAMLKNLKKLTQLRKLGVTSINKSNCKELCSAIADHGRLQSLLLRAEGNAGLQGCLDDLSPPPEHLESLQLYGNLMTLPEWIKQLENVQKISLRSTNLKADAAMEVLGNLPMLVILRLQDNACEEEELRFGPECFTGLTTLEFVNWWSLKSVKFEGGATPKLKALLVDNCEQINNGGFSGIETVSSLKEVSLLGYNYDQTYTEFKEQLQQQLNMIKPKPDLKIL